MGDSPFWSHLILRWFVEPTCSRASKWRSTVILQRSEEILSSIALLTFIVARWNTICTGESLEHDKIKIYKFLYAFELHLDAIKVRLQSRVTKSCNQSFINESSSRENVQIAFSNVDILKLELICSNIERYHNLLHT